VDGITRYVARGIFWHSTVGAEEITQKPSQDKGSQDQGSNSECKKRKQAFQTLKGKVRRKSVKIILAVFEYSPLSVYEYF
jgi:hypothetical protein